VQEIKKGAGSIGPALLRNHPTVKFKKNNNTKNYHLDLNKCIKAKAMLMK
jgi:hypothetical protein